VEFASLDFGDLWSRPEEFLATLRSLLSDAPDSDENDTEENDTEENDDSDENDADEGAETDPDGGDSELQAFWNALHDFCGTSGDSTPPNGDHSTPPEGQVSHSNLSGFSGFFENLFELVSSHKESGDYWLSS
jgi:hypothetical protein